MNIPAKCKSCGYNYTSNSIHIENSFGVTLSGNTETCPRCGARAQLQSGTYDFVGDVISAFRAPGMSREKISTLKALAEKAKNGEITAEDAVENANKIDPAIQRMLKTAQDRGITIGDLLTLITLIFAFWTHWSSNADVQAALGEAQRMNETTLKQLSATEKQREISEKILLELGRLNAAAQTEEAKKQKLQQAPKETPVSVRPNRKERRKAAAIARKKKD
jgi:hypothetical protein